MHPPSLVEASILALATWRVTSLITWERGPLHVFERIRAAAGIRHNEWGKPNVIPETFWGELLTCLWCCSIYVGAFWAIAFAGLGAVAVILALPFALSTAALWIGKYVK